MNQDLWKLFLILAVGRMHLDAVISLTEKGITGEELKK